MDYREIIKRIKGPLVPIIPAYTNDYRLDINSTLAWVEWQLEQGIKVFWTTPGSTNFMCVSDQEIMDLTKSLAQTIKGKGLFIASSSWSWSTRQTMEFVDFAVKHNVDVIKLCIDWQWLASDDLIIEHYKSLARKSPLPLLAYTCAVPGKTKGMGADLLRRIIEIPQFVGFKNDSGDFREQQYYLRVIREHASTDQFTSITGGCMDSFYYTYELGSRVYGDIVAIYAPRTSLEFYDAVVSDKRKKAREIIEKHEEPMFEYAPKLGSLMTWSLIRAILHIKGFYKSPKSRFPFRSLNDKEMATAKMFIEQQEILSLSEF